MERRHGDFNTYLAANELAGGASVFCVSSVADDVTFGLAGLVEEMWSANSDARDPNPALILPPLGRTLQWNCRSRWIVAC